MKHTSIGLLAVFVFSLAAPFASADPIGSGFTYQGRLQNGAVSANGQYDFSFELFPGPYDSLASSGLTNLNVSVSNGLFTTTVDFGPTLMRNGNGYWLEVGVRPSGGTGAFTMLSPRQRLTPAPYAQYAPVAGVADSAGTASTAAQANSVVNNAISAAQLNTSAGPGPGQILGYNGNSLVWTNPSTGTAWSTTGNTGTSPANGNYLGTADSQPLELRVNGSRALRLEAGSSNGAPNVIGGSPLNSMPAGQSGVVIAGGGSLSMSNRVDSSFSTIGGGDDNLIQTNADFATIGGGTGNQVQPGATRGWIGGGQANVIGTDASYAAIPGGVYNKASGICSLAAGSGSQALHQGSFVWSDTAPEPNFASTGPNQFLIRANGGVGIGTNNPQTALHVNGNVTAVSFVGDGSRLRNVNALQSLFASWPLSSSGGNNPVISLASASAAGQYLRSSSAYGWAVSAIPVADVPNLSSIYVDLVGNQNVPGNKTFSGVLTGSYFVGNGVGLTNVNATSLNGFAAANFWRLGGNSVSPGQSFGTVNSQPLEFIVYGRRGFRLEPTGTEAVNLVGGSTANYISPTVHGSVIAGGGISAETNTVLANLAFLGGGRGNSIGWAADSAFLGGGKGNSISNTAVSCFLGGGLANSIGQTANYSLVVGGVGNSIMDNSQGCFLGGGANNLIRNDCARCVLSGGVGNSIGSYTENSFLGGGVANVIQSVTSYACLGGGYHNSLGGEFAVLAGGAGNTILTGARLASLGGGESNTNAGFASVVPGGKNNYAGGSVSFAAGYGAKALHDGTFVWSDTSGMDFASTGPNEFLIRAVGGVAINKSSPATALDVNGTVTATSFVGDATLGQVDVTGEARVEYVTATTQLRIKGARTVLSGFDGTGSHWFGPSPDDDLAFGIRRVGANHYDFTLKGGDFYANAYYLLSDRNAKENFQAIDPEQVLEKVTQLPVTEWNYKGDCTTRHVGPMAQDFHDAFGLGADEKHIGTVDADGVALAAIQGLNHKLERQLQQKESEIRDLKTRLERLERRFMAEDYR